MTPSSGAPGRRIAVRGAVTSTGPDTRARHRAGRVVEARIVLDLLTAGVAGRSAAPSRRGWAAGHHEHPIGQRHCLGDAVGDEQYGAAGALPQLQEQVAHLVAVISSSAENGSSISSTRSAEHEAAHQRHSLLHAAGELVGPAVEELGEPDGLEHLERLCWREGAWAAPWVDLAEQPDVLAHGAPRQQRRIPAGRSRSAWSRVPRPGWSPRP